MWIQTHTHSKCVCVKSHDLGIPIANTGTNADNYGIGYSTMTIFIEGWDHTVIDKAVGYSFNLGLRFEINRI